MCLKSCADVLLLQVRPHCQFSESNLLSFGCLGISNQLEWLRNLHMTILANNSTDCNPVPPLKVLPDYKKWPIQFLYPLLLGVLTRLTLTDSRKFLVY